VSRDHPDGRAAELALGPPYPVEGWHIRQTDFDATGVGTAETIFATANGYLGLRGNLEEANPVVERGTYLNGFYESRPYVYPESAYGFARDAQTMLNVTDGKVLRLTVDGEPLDIATGTLIEHDRVLDLRQGYAGRETVWESPGGKRVSVRTRRLVSLAHRHLAVIEYEVTALEEAVTLEITSELIANESDETRGDDPREVASYWGQVLQPVWERLDGTRIGLGHTVARSGLTVFCVADHRIDTRLPHRQANGGEDGSRAWVAITVDAQPGEPFRLVKYLAYTYGPDTQRDHLLSQADALLDRALGDRMPDLIGSQTAILDSFWRDCHLTVHGDDEVQQAVRFGLFQIVQASARAEQTGIPAKGLTGQGYGGHYFWDMEAYVLHVLTYLAPEHAARALRFRHATLDAARAHARSLSMEGALFPWRTINGEEASAFFPAGTAEYHIDADIAEAVQHYVEVTGDEQFLVDHGAELLIETARMWAGLGFFDDARGGAFCIHGVTGPDEYTAMVDNNTFTNLMARANLEHAAAAVDRLRQDHPDALAALAARIQLDDAEVDRWREAASRMYLHYDEERGLHGQDDSFLDKEPWDLSTVPADQRPLLLHFHPLNLYRRQVIKQADLVMAMFLQGQHFTPEQKARNFAYYDPITTADSSLSLCVQAIVAAEVGQVDLAWDYARRTALTDLDDVNHNVHDGIHIAAVAGTWMALVCGFGGLRRRDGTLWFDPKLPAGLDGISFRLRFHDRMVEVAVSPTATTYSLHRGDDVVVMHRGEPLTIPAATPVTVAHPGSADAR
jgi:alpha,alpha-trehalose phosphorylase